MNKKNPSHGIWDEPIPEDIAQTIGSGEQDDSPKQKFDPTLDYLPTPNKDANKPTQSKESAEPLDDNGVNPGIEKKPVPDEGPVNSNAEHPSEENISPFQESEIKNNKDCSESIESKPEEKKVAFFGNASKFTKPTIIRASVKSVYPHIVIALVCIVLALFPSLFISVLGDVSTIPAMILENLPTIVTTFFILFSIFIFAIMSKELATGSLWLYEGFLKFKKGLIRNEMHYYGNIQAVEVQRSVSSLWSDTGDLIILYAKGSITLCNVGSPFTIRNEIRERILHHEKNNEKN